MSAEEASAEGRCARVCGSSAHRLRCACNSARRASISRLSCDSISVQRSRLHAEKLPHAAVLRSQHLAQFVAPGVPRGGRRSGLGHRRHGRGRANDGAAQQVGVAAQGVGPGEEGVRFHDCQRERARLSSGPDPRCARRIGPASALNVI